ncbi:helix-turn-helix transcriptional regulator [Mycobacterium decipiens]|uniref:HTH luxR-type domain-containing protein n=1 Tax=Mycobacterium decipiens TaxID=1430326 RepID=A0A1X2LQT6_9MYCO|nr:LuxR family transcriptional regulator [Mycobacterium decipiens]OSC38738.1 hypothetical protein B8W66_19240 [Mycobacterium decipiens]
MAEVDNAAKAFDRQAWAEAYACLTDAGQPLDGDDLDRLAITAYLLGKDEESSAAWERAYSAFTAVDDLGGAARCGFWLALTQLLGGKSAQASGWLGRIGRLAQDGELIARGYLLVPDGIAKWRSGDSAAALALYTEAVTVADRVGDSDLAALASLGQGQALITGGQAARGVGLLDEVMLRVTTGEVSPIPAGIIYCAVIEACMGVFDLRRAAEWTEALSRHCEAQPDLVPYRGQCLVHRSQILQIHGEWQQAMAAAGLAWEWLSKLVHPALGLAAYQRAELHRLRGEFAEAHAAYRQASQHGREPVPGLALLRLAEGDVHAATVAIRRAVDATTESYSRPSTLAALVEIMLAAGDVAAARTGADELAAIAEDIAAPFLDAVAAHAAGSTLLAEGDSTAAQRELQRAMAAWRQLEMPYEAARTRVQIGLACRAVNDHDLAGLEFDAAREVFEQLGAKPDLSILAGLVRGQAGALTTREGEVLRLVAAGKTNREVAAQLVLSEHTVARHLQNIFAKLGLSSRAAATAYAYEHHLV